MTSDASHLLNHHRVVLGAKRLLRQVGHLLLDRRDDVADLVDDRIFHLQARPDEALVLHVIEEDTQRIPEAADIGDDHGLRMAAELRPGQLLDKFLQRADAAGSATKASASVNMRILRVCMSGTVTTSMTASSGISLRLRKSG